MQPTIGHFDPTREYWFEEGCFINELSNTVDDTALSIARARVPPEGTTCWHLLEGITERYVILEGSALVELQDMTPTILGPGDVVVIPPGVCQRITNTGQGDLVFLALCTPRFCSDAYRALQ